VPAPGTALDPERGLASLPAPSPGDLSFDIEGDPFALDDGLDYLFGVSEADGTFHAFWSRDDAGEFSLAGERRAFEAFIDFVMARLAVDPDLHVYHYAPYEPTALKRLMGRYATREDEVDHLLRAGVLVDLLRVVRQSLRASVDSYSIKRLEAFYGFERQLDLRDAGSSIVAFEQWLELGEGERPAADHLERIERYNEDDVISNRLLRDWLEGRRVELADQLGFDVPRPVARDVDPPTDLTEAQARVAALAERLAPMTTTPEDPIDRTPDVQARWLMAQLLGWHRREEKAMWWEFHRLMDLTPEQLVDEDEAVGLLEPVEAVDLPGRGGRQTWRYTYPEQEMEVGRDPVYDPRRKQDDPDGNPSDWRIGEVVAVDLAARTIDVRRGMSDPHSRALVPLRQFGTAAHRERLMEVGEWIADHGLDGPGPYRAARDLLRGAPPRVGQAPGAALRRDGETELAAARRLGVALDGTTLAIQGPPGAGKTYSGARMICTLVRAGRRVGITGMSHKVISNLLTAVLDAAEDEDAAIRAVQHNPSGDVVDDPRVAKASGAEDVRTRLEDDRANVAAGTSWLWTSPKLAGAVDVLFVDEAGQISLANVVAMAGATENLVLLGDPQQLDQPLQGTHPPGADRSALAHLLGDAATMPPDRGLFLATTWRLHPDLCAFTSEAFYDGRLEPESHLAGQTLHTGPTADLADGTGPRLVASPSREADSASDEEAAAVAMLAQALAEGGARWTDEHGVTRPMGWNDVLIVAPYNAQVGAIQRLLPAAARVGTVDKFQGQEAPVSIYSLTTSSPELAPRGMDFLYSRNRLNVATSRARGVAIVVAAPDLFRVRARTPEQMRLANAFCRFAELAAAEGAVRLDDATADRGAGVEVLTLGLEVEP
ncbi:MAG TPA: TM0106 family RecB-like putative nuclease, partial [Candidatus Limnocylindrales bacterium]